MTSYALHTAEINKTHGASFTTAPADVMYACLLRLAVIVFLLSALAAEASETQVRIGVLRHRGGDIALKWWSPTAKYLSQRIPGYSFTLVPMGLQETKDAVQGKTVDFLLTNPGNFVELQATQGLKPLLTLRNLRQGKPYTQFGAVIFVRADRDDIQTLSDLKGKSFIGVKRGAFGGFQMGWRELKARGIDPFADFSKLYFSGFPQDGVTYAVRDGLVDAGTVRTDTLERMAAEGKINLKNFRILNARQEGNFPFALSTPLYPEWPFAKLATTSEELAAAVVSALLALPADGPVARAANSAGWAKPLDYQPVHDLMRELRIGPYQAPAEITLSAIIDKYYYWIVVIAVFAALLLAGSVYVVQLNCRLVAAKAELETEIEEREKAQVQIHRLSQVVEQSGDIVFITSCNSIIEYVNPGFERATGYTRDEAIGRRSNILASGQHGVEFYSNLWKTIEKGHIFRDIFTNRKKDGSLYYEEKSISPMKDDKGVVTHYVSTGKDVSDRVEAQEHLDYLAYHDVLTGLPNRTLFLDRLNHAMQKAQRTNTLVALLFLDLDGFKTINDSLGHIIGDMLLKEVASRLTENMRQDDTVARLGGDEFTIVLEDINHVDDITAATEKTLAVFNNPFHIDRHELFVSASIGIAIHPFLNSTIDDLVKAADTAMYRAKEEGRNSYRFYTADMTDKVSRRFIMENELRHALKRNEFLLYYQPQADLRDGNIIGVEALIRWQHPQRGLVSPKEFIPVLEDSGLIGPVGKWVLNTAATQLSSFHVGTGTPLRVAVNLSPQQFRSATLIYSIVRILEETRISPHSLTLEITESVLMLNHERVAATLAALKNMGIQIAIDDFGTGYSSLSYLKKFPIDILKLDITFIRDITSDEENAALVSGIITMGHALKLKVVAEGVETIEQMQLLKDFECDVMQGYLLGKPMPLDELNSLLGKGGCPNSGHHTDQTLKPAKLARS